MAEEFDAFATRNAMRRSVERAAVKSSLRALIDATEEICDRYGLCAAEEMDLNAKRFE
jgi:hypothetical protein